MKRRELIRRLTEMGCALIRHGAKHDWYQNPATKVTQPVPRHTEIKDPLPSTLSRCSRVRANISLQVESVK